MIQRWLNLISLAALAVCAAGCHAGNLSGWGHTPQTAVPVVTSVAIRAACVPSRCATPKQPRLLFIPLLAMFCSAPMVTLHRRPGSHFHDDMAEVWPNIKQDYRNYYSWENLGMLVAGFSVGAVFANTKSTVLCATSIRTMSVRLAPITLPKCARILAMADYMLPVMAAGWLAGEIFPDSACGARLANGVSAACVPHLSALLRCC